MSHTWLMFWGLGCSAGLLLAMGSGCGDSGTGASGPGGGSNGGAYEGGGAVCGLEPARNSEFCASTPASPNCELTSQSDYHVCGVPLDSTPEELERSSSVVEFSGNGPPDVSCFQVANYPDPPGESQPVTVTGFARIFSSGCNSHDLKITFYKVQADGQLGEAIGDGVVTPETCVDIGEQSETDNCERWECEYTYEGVPSETELAVKTENGPGTELWAPLVQYNVYIPNAEIVDGGWDHNVRALAEPDYSVIPQTAIGALIAPGHGAVAGEVHDCGDVRLKNAVADIDRAHVLTTYFTSDEDGPLPDQAADGTSVLGLYAALDVPEGQVTVAAGGFVNGEFVSLGQHRAWVYPDTVTSVTFKGIRPYQVE